jgi:hypothetical protein
MGGEVSPFVFWCAEACPDDGNLEHAIVPPIRCGCLYQTLKPRQQRQPSSDAWRPWRGPGMHSRACICAAAPNDLLASALLYPIFLFSQMKSVSSFRCGATAGGTAKSSQANLADVLPGVCV